MVLGKQVVQEWDSATLLTEGEAFGGMIAGAAAWAIWGGDVFPPERDPTGNPETWTREEMRRWLAAVSNREKTARNPFGFWQTRLTPP